MGAVFCSWNSLGASERLIVACCSSRDECIAPGGPEARIRSVRFGWFAGTDAKDYRDPGNENVVKLEHYPFVQLWHVLVIQLLF